MILKYLPFYRVLIQSKSTFQKGDLKTKKCVHQGACGWEQRSHSCTGVKVWLWGSLYPLASHGHDIQYQTTGDPRWDWHIPIHSTLDLLGQKSVIQDQPNLNSTEWSLCCDIQGKKVYLNVIFKRVLFQHGTLIRLFFSIYWCSFLQNLSEVKIVAHGDMKSGW